MKKRLIFLAIFSILILTFSNSYSVPLNGTYTIGSGGDYPAIDSALGVAEKEGISGPVIFNILTGIYNETINIHFIPGNSSLNTLTLKSFTGNTSDVEINHISIVSAFITIRDISINSDILIESHSNNINIINNDFRNSGLYLQALSFVGDIHNVKILGNVNITIMDFFAEYWFVEAIIDSVQIKNNTINGAVRNFGHCYNFLIENNTIYGSLSGAGGPTFEILKNKITGNLFITGKYTNNFINGNIQSGGIFINNTITGGSIDTPTVNLKYVSWGSYFHNNIIINKNGGTVLSSMNELIASDFNNYSNGGNNNLVMYGGISYNNIQDFFNATGFDQHSNSQPVSFVSPTDLHLAFSSYGDTLLMGIPVSSVIDDIDGELRNSLYPYKGADEILDFPLPVELSLFSSSVNENDVILNWVTTSELNNSGFDIERSKVNASDNEWLKIGFVKGNGTSSNTNTYEYTDKNVNSGKYNYRLKQIDFNGNFKYYNLSEEVTVGIPGKYSLNQNFPNPFNPETIISYQIPSDHNVLIKIYDISGKEVLTLVNEYEVAGSYEIKFNGSNFASGIYYYQIEAGEFKATKKMLLVK